MLFTASLLGLKGILLRAVLIDAPKIRGAASSQQAERPDLVVFVVHRTTFQPTIGALGAGEERI